MLDVQLDPADVIDINIEPDAPIDVEIETVRLVNPDAPNYGDLSDLVTLTNYWLTYGE